MSLSKLWEIVKDREAGELQFMGSQSQTRLSNWTTTNVIKYVFFQEQHMISLLFSLYVVNHIDWLFDANPGINKLGCAVLSFLCIFTLSDGEGNGSPLQYSCLENPMDGGAWWAAVHGVAKSRTRLSDFTFTFHFHALEKERATHSRVLAWRTPGMGEPGRLLSVGSHRVRHDWSDLVVVVH